MARQSSNLGAPSSTRVRRHERNKRTQNGIHGEQPKKQRHYPSSQLTVTTAHPSSAAVPVMAMTTFPFAAGVNGAAGQLVSVQPPLISYDYEQATMAMEEALQNIKSYSLGRLLTAVMQSCDPPMMLQRQRWTGGRAPPPWWPSPAADASPELTTPVVPFAPPYKLRKEEKVAVLVAIVKHHAPDLDVFSGDAMCEKAKLSGDPEAADWWKRALSIMAPPHAGGDGNLLAATEYVEQGDSEQGLVVGGAEPEQQEEQFGDGVLDGGAMAGDAYAVDFLGEEFASAEMDQLLDDMLLEALQNAEA